MVKSSYSTLPIYSILEMAALPYKPTFELNFIDEIASQSAPAHQYYLLWHGSKCNFFLKSKYRKSPLVLYTLNQ